MKNVTDQLVYIPGHNTITQNKDNIKL